MLIIKDIDKTLAVVYSESHVYVVQELRYPVPLNKSTVWFYFKKTLVKNPFNAYSWTSIGYVLDCGSECVRSCRRRLNTVTRSSRRRRCGATRRRSCSCRRRTTACRATGPPPSGSGTPEDKMTAFFNCKTEDQ